MGIACRSSGKTTSSKMNAFVAVVASLVAAANAGVAPLAGAPLLGAPLVAGKTLVRAPAHDSASIANHRLGGNFAYAVQTAEAFAEVTPKIAHQTIPVAEHTHVHQPAAIRTIQPAPIVKKVFSASPVLAQKPVFGTEPVIGPVGQEVHVQQPVYKTRTYTQTHQVAQTVAAPAVAVGTVAAAAPAAIGAYAAAPAAYGAIAAAPAGIAAAPAVGAIGYGGYALGAGQLAGGYALGAGQLAGGYALGAGHLAGAAIAPAAALPVAVAEH